MSPFEQEDIERFCLGCDYPLKGLTENRCPECGREFDPNVPETFSDQPPLHPVKVLLLKPIGWPTFLLAGGGSLLWLLMYDYPATPNLWLLLALLLWLAVGVWWLVRLLSILAMWVCKLSHRYSPRRHAWRWLIPPVLLALSVAGATHDVKFRIRFFLSKPAMERLVQQGAQLPQGGKLPDQTVGLFEASEIRAYPGYLLFSFATDRRNDPFERGFAYSASGTRPKLHDKRFNRPFNTGENGCRRFSGNWYLWWRLNF